MSKGFSKKQLEQLAKAGGLLIFPKNAKKLYKEKEEYLRSIGATDEDIDTGCDLCPESFWWEACELVEKLAQELLDEREKKFDDLMAPLEDVERELKVLKKTINSKFKGYE